jgi:hypothetical protein
MLCCKAATKLISCITPSCTMLPGTAACGLCSLPLCAECEEFTTECGQCKALLCDRCDEPDSEHQQSIDMSTNAAWQKEQSRKSYKLEPPCASTRHSIDCGVCAKRHCWMCWQSWTSESDPCWLCDDCQLSACMFCVVIVDPVEGWDVSSSWGGGDRGGGDPAHVICNTCFGEDGGGGRFSSKYW